MSLSPYLNLALFHGVVLVWMLSGTRGTHPAGHVGCHPDDPGALLKDPNLFGGYPVTEIGDS